jgi:plastocyanin
MNRLLPLAASLLLASSLTAQTTHDVAVGPGFDFVPADLSIHVGDTVRWTWAGSFAHNVESGDAGVPDGIFSSGAPVTGAGTTYEVTFDDAFLAANPVPGNDYDYYCSIHVTFGMTAVVRVNTDYGCTAPADSLIEVSGAPHVGQTWTLGVDNPVPGGQTPGSLAVLGVATQPAPGFPCGLALPGFHMDPATAAGELLLSFVPPNPLVIAGPVAWSGPGSPASIALPFPSTPTLVGIEIYTQGMIFDPTGSNTFGASRGIRATIGG